MTLEWSQPLALLSLASVVPIQDYTSLSPHLATPGVCVCLYVHVRVFVCACTFPPSCPVFVWSSSPSSFAQPSYICVCIECVCSCIRMSLFACLLPPCVCVCFPPYRPKRRLLITRNWLQVSLLTSMLYDPVHDHVPASRCRNGINLPYTLNILNVQPLTAWKNPCDGLQQSSSSFPRHRRCLFRMRA